MYALVFFKKSKDVSIVPYENIKGEGKEAKVKWGSQWYAAEILKISEKKDWLESLEVNVNGDIIVPHKKSTISDDLLLKKKDCRKEEKREQSCKRAAEQEKNNLLLQKKSIFDCNQETESESDCESDYLNSVKEIDLKSMNESDEIKSINEEAKSMNEEEKSINEIDKIAFENKKCICSQLPLVTEQNIKNLKEILKLAEFIHFNQNKSEVNLDKTLQIAKSPLHMLENQTKKNKEIELIENSSVFVDEFKVRNIQTIYYKRPRDMARQLIRLIVTDEVLKISSTTGRNGWKPIPTHIFESVERFINENAPKKKYQIGHQEYRQVSTALCATLRNPKKEYKDVNKSNSFYNKVDYNKFMQDTEKMQKENQRKEINEFKEQSGKEINEKANENDESINETDEEEIYTSRLKGNEKEKKKKRNENHIKNDETKENNYREGKGKCKSLNGTYEKSEEYSKKEENSTERQDRTKYMQDKYKNEIQKTAEREDQKRKLGNEYEKIKFIKKLKP